MAMKCLSSKCASLDRKSAWIVALYWLQLVFGWYSDVLNDVVVGISTPAMERYTMGFRSIIMMFVIVWPDT